MVKKYLAKKKKTINKFVYMNVSYMKIYVEVSIPIVNVGTESRD